MIRPETIALAARAGNLSVGEFWRALSKEMRLDALGVFLSKEGDDRKKRRRLIASVVAKTGGFSLPRLLVRPDAELAQTLLRVRAVPETVALPVLAEYFVEAESRPQHRFFVATGNEDALAEGSDLIKRDFGTESGSETRKGVEALTSTNQDFDVLYLIGVAVGFAKHWPGIADALAEWSRRASAPESSVEPEAPGLLAADAVAEVVGPPASDMFSGPLSPSRPPIIVAEAENVSSIPGDARLSAPEAPPIVAVTDERLAKPAEVPSIAPEPRPETQQRFEAIEAPPREDEKGLSVLDRALERIAEEAFNGTIGAFPADEVRELLKELRSLNSYRSRSYWSAGFADGLFDECSTEDLGDWSHSERTWYVSGYVLGCSRRLDTSAILNAMESERGKLLVGQPGPALAKVAPILAKTLAQSGRLGDLGRLAPNLAHDSLETITILAREGKAALDREDPGLANALLEPALAALQGFDEQASEAAGPEIDRLSLQVQRRLAHAFRLQRRFQDAKRQIGALLVDPPDGESDPEIRSMLLTDMGLMNAGFRELADIEIPDSKDRSDEIRERLSDEREHFEKAVQIDSAVAAHAKYVLGVLTLLGSGGEGRAANLLDEALDAFQSAPAVYTNRGLLKRARFYGALAGALSLEVGSLQPLAGLLARNSGTSEGVRLPKQFVGRVLDLSGLTDDLASMAEIILALHDQGQIGTEELISAAKSSPSEALTRVAIDLARNENESAGNRVAAAHAVLAGGLERNTRDENDEILSIAHDGALDSLGVDEFLRLPDGVWEAAEWDRRDRLWALGRVALKNAREVQASDFARRGFFGALETHGAPEWEGDALEFLELMRHAGSSEEDIGDLRRRVVAATATEQRPRPKLRPGAHHCIAIIGGNETQRQYQDDIRQRVESEFGGAVTCNFIVTGMESNWNKPLAEFERLLPRIHGVVMYRFIRTMFGWNVRRRLDGRPWRLCGASGKGRVLDLIAAVVMDLENRQANGR